jgi:hypothetical protein
MWLDLAARLSIIAGLATASTHGSLGRHRWFARWKKSTAPPYKLIVLCQSARAKPKPVPQTGMALTMADDA